MKTYLALLKRNVKLFFKDKGLFFTSLITPLILLVLYATFLANVYCDSVNGIFQQMGVTLSQDLLNGVVGGQLTSSLLSVSCITVAFCSNMLLVQDKVSGARKDLLLSPVKRSTLAFSYFSATFISTLIVCVVATIAGLTYVAFGGWFLSAVDVFLILFDVIVLVAFGTALSSIINHFLSTQGQISAVGSIVSSCYGFICGAYMPLSSFSEGLRNAVMFLPGTYGTSLIKNHTLRGVFDEMIKQGIPKQAIEGVKDAVDCNVYFFDNKVALGTCFAVLMVTVVLLITAFVLINVFSKSKSK